MINASKPIEILLIEDNPGDVILTREAFADGKIANNINVVEDGELALAYLEKRDGYDLATTPDLILLDLNLPKIDGRQVLEAIKTNEQTRSIPVVILTSSEAEKDIIKTYDLHANSYIVKPLSLDQFAKVVAAIENFWFTVVVLPTDADKIPRH